MIELVAIVSSFNRAALLKDALASLSEQLLRLPLQSAIVVFDARSRDDSHEVIEQAKTKGKVLIHLIEGVDVSFAAGVNAAALFARQKFPTTKFLLLFETDNFLESADPLLKAIELLQQRNDLAAVGFTARKHDGSPSGFGCAFPRSLDFVLGPQIAYRFGLDQPEVTWNTSKEIRWAECDVVYTSPIVIRAETWEQSSGFDSAEFPFSDCDLDWAWRLRISGLKQAVVETNQVIHDNQQQLSNWSATRALHFHRARVALLKRHRRARTAMLLPLLFLRHCLELAILAITPRPDYALRIKSRWQLARGALRGYR